MLGSRYFLFVPPPLSFPSVIHSLLHRRAAEKGWEEDRGIAAPPLPPLFILPFLPVFLMEKQKDILLAIPIAWLIFIRDVGKQGPKLIDLRQTRACCNYIQGDWVGLTLIRMFQNLAQLPIQSCHALLCQAETVWLWNCQNDNHSNIGTRPPESHRDRGVKVC